MKHYISFSLLTVLLLGPAIAQAQIDPNTIRDPNTPLTNPEDVHYGPRGVRKVFDPATGRMVDIDAVHRASLARLRQAEAVYKQAEAFYLKKQIAKAVPLYLKALEIEEDLSDARVRLGDIYLQQKRSADVLKILTPIVLPPSNKGFSDGVDIRTRMKFILASLDMGRWEEAAVLYEKSLQNDPLTWSLLHYSVASGNKEHTLPVVHFSPGFPDVAGLRTRAHLILAIRPPDLGTLGDEAEQREYVLDQLRQVIQLDRNCLDAHFIRGIVLRDAGRFEEARASLGRAFAIAPREARPEIKEALVKLTERENLKKQRDAQQAANVTRADKR